MHCARSTHHYMHTSVALCHRKIWVQPHAHITHNKIGQGEFGEVAGKLCQRGQPSSPWGWGRRCIGAAVEFGEGAAVEFGEGAGWCSGEDGVVGVGRRSGGGVAHLGGSPGDDCQWSKRGRRQWDGSPARRRRRRGSGGVAPASGGAMNRWQRGECEK